MPKTLDTRPDLPDAERLNDAEVTMLRQAREQNGLPEAIIAARSSGRVIAKLARAGLIYDASGALLIANRGRAVLDAIEQGDWLRRSLDEKSKEREP